MNRATKLAPFVILLVLSYALMFFATMAEFKSLCPNNYQMNWMGGMCVIKSTNGFVCVGEKEWCDEKRAEHLERFTPTEV